ncbi:hypothetical protein [Exiguobacterium sp. s168]|uniref:hypothetical protein n=1 Tax=Exiguobacterium sp. s168 TaxID=2751194 RepID=UPI001BE6FF63|nr:hypothetical protein [Exiguobacterium sp. s168]
MEHVHTQTDALAALYEEMHQKTKTGMWVMLAAFLALSNTLEKPVYAIIVPLLYFGYDMLLQRKRFALVAEYTSKDSARRLYQVHVLIGILQYGALAGLIVWAVGRPNTSFLIGLVIIVIPFYWLCRKALEFVSRKIDPTYVTEKEIHKPR